MGRHLKLDPLPDPIRPGVHDLDRARPTVTAPPAPATLREAWDETSPGDRRHLAMRNPELAAAIVRHLQGEDQ